ncbi:MAG: methylglutaconyl-CoA hydratase [Patescibacteria group bacterium]|jgi:methylglutaconyl-CoA hydratase
MNDKIQQGSVETQIENGIATITFYHPSHNSLPGNLLAKLVGAITAAGEDDDVKVLLLKSAGERTFCAGASFDELSSIENEEVGYKFFMGFANVINACRKCPKLIVGRVQGKAVGGGVGVASAVDYCLATKFASVKLSELAVGIGPFVVGPAVARKIGTSAMSQLAIDATEWRSAEWAKEKGLYAGVYEDVEKMDEAITALLQKLVESNPQAMSMLKKVFWEGTENWDQLLSERAGMSGKLVLSDFTANAISAFKAKA